MQRALSTAALALALCTTLPATALEWICTTPGAPERVAVSAADADAAADAAFAPAAASGTSKAHRQARLGLADLTQAYSGQPVLIGHTWLLAVMLPAAHPDTRAAFAALGLNPEAVERMASTNGLVDRGIRVVRTPAELIQKVANNPPAVGYTRFFTGATDVGPCF